MQAAKVIKAHEVRVGDVVYTDLRSGSFTSHKVRKIHSAGKEVEITIYCTSFFDMMLSLNKNDRILLISRQWPTKKPANKMIGKIVRLLPRDRDERLSLWDFHDFCENKKDLTDLRDAIDEYLMGLPG